MNKKICDICGKDAVLNGKDSNTYNSEQLMFEDKLLCDEKAKINITIHTHFLNHSKGFGGPPDLCPDCFVELVRQTYERVKEYAKLLSTN